MTVKELVDDLIGQMSEGMGEDTPVYIGSNLGETIAANRSYSHPEKGYVIEFKIPEATF